jgi:nucleotide-binding universal stress UspA family protein
MVALEAPGRKGVDLRVRGVETSVGGVVTPLLNRGAGRVVRRARRPYREVAKERRRPTMNTILVGTDTSAAADLAVEDAARLARDRGAELLVLYVRPEADLRSVVDPGLAADPSAYLDRIPLRFPDISARTRMERGDPADRIVDVAEEESVDTIVMGNRGVHGSRWRVRGSVPNIVLRHAPCSVFIVDTRRAQ